MAVDAMARIWLTYKARIISEKRFNRYAVISHLALTWYAFLSIVFSIYQTDIAKTLGVVGANQASLVMAVLTFGLSLVIYGFKFEDAARVHRECYLRMQSLYQSSKSDEIKLEEYRKLLDHFPNHSSGDYQELLFSGWKSGRSLSGTDGNPIKFNYKDAVVVYLNRSISFSLFALIFIIPSALIIYWLSAN